MRHCGEFGPFFAACLQGLLFGLSVHLTSIGLAEYLLFQLHPLGQVRQESIEGSEPQAGSLCCP
jgi:hypothetical protein